MKRRMLLTLILAGALSALLLPIRSVPAQYEDSFDCDKMHDFCYSNWYQSTLWACQARGEGDGGGWSSYSSCECSAAREYKRCMDQTNAYSSTEGTGCRQKSQAMLQGVEQCFTPQ